MGRTQLKLQQLTGSIGNAAGKIRTDVAKSAIASIAAVDLTGSLSHIASAVARIHGLGSSEAFNANPGEFYQDLSIKTAGAASLTIGDGTAADSKVVFDGNAQDFYIGLDDTDDSLKIGLGSAVGTTTSITLESANRDVILHGNLGLGDAAQIGSATTADLLVVNANDVTVKATKSLKVDIIAESAGDAGVTIDGVLIKDNDIVIPNGSTIGSVGAAAAMTIDASGIVAFIDDIKIKDGGTIGVASVADALTLAANGDLTLKEDLKFADGKLLGSATTADLVTVNANDIQIKATKSLKVDVISESAGAAGVTIDGVLIKDNDIIVPDGATIGSVTAPTALTIASNGDLTALRDVIITGDLTVSGATVTMDVATMIVEDKNIAVAKGAANAAAVRGAGLDILHGGSGSEAVEGYIRVGAADASIFELRAPGNDFDLTLDINATKTITVAGALSIEADSVINQDLSTDASVVFAGLSLAEGNLTNAGDINCDSLSVDDAAVGLDIVFGGNNSLNKISLLDNMADALSIKEAGNAYMTFATQNGTERIEVIKQLKVLGQIDMAVAGENSISIPDGQADALTFKEAGNFYMKLRTSDGSEAIELHKQLDMKEQNIINAGAISADVLQIDDAAVGLNIDVSASNTGLAKVSLRDNMAAAFDITEAGNSYLKFVTSNSSEAIVASKLLQAGSNLEFTVAGENAILIPDNQADSLVVKEGSAVYAQFQTSDGQEKIQFLKDTFVDAAFLGLKNGNNSSGKLQIFEDVDNGSDYIALTVPAAVGTSYTITLPAAAPANEQVLQSDGSGNLSWVALEPQKAVRIISGSGFPAGLGVSVATAQLQAGAEVTGMATAESQGRSLDVFVNGQMLLSGSEGERAAGTRDYAVSGAQELKFAFALEVDDIVQVIKR